MTTVAEARTLDTAPTTANQPRQRRPWGQYVLLLLGAFVFLFPFYYMLIGSIQPEPDTSPAGALPLHGVTLNNYTDINSRINLGRSLLNSGIFTGGVILLTVVFGVLAGYALARLHFRGKGVVFAAMLLIQVVPFQPAAHPAVRDDRARLRAGRQLPGHDRAVRHQLDGGVRLPAVLPAACRTTCSPPPASTAPASLRVLWSIALPLVRPALLTAVLLTFIGPWNEFLWPFLVTKDADLQPLAVSLANYISNVASRAANPFGAILAGACVLAAPAVALFAVFQRHFTSTEPRIGSQGMTTATTTVPYTLTRVGTVMEPDPSNPHEVAGVLNPASGRTPDGRLHLLPRLVAEGNVSRVGLAEVEPDRRGAHRRPAARRGARAGRGLGARRGQRRRRGPAHHLGAVARSGRHARHDVRRVRAARPEARARRLDRPRALDPARAGADGVPARPRHRPEPVPQQGRRVVPRGRARPRRRAVVRRAAPPDVGPGLDPPRRDHAPAGRRRRRAAGHLDLVRRGRRRAGRPQRADPAAQAPGAGHARVRLRGAEDRRRPATRPRRRGLAAAAPRRGGVRAAGLRPDDAAGVVRGGGHAARPRGPVPGAGAHQRAADVAGDGRRAHGGGVERGVPDGDRGGGRRDVRLLRHGGREDRRRPAGAAAMRRLLTALAAVAVAAGTVTGVGAASAQAAPRG
nr:carbohydrate ABC transporter permease [Angustibacter aerolatus]